MPLAGKDLATSGSIRCYNRCVPSREFKALNPVEKQLTVAGTPSWLPPKAIPLMFLTMAIGIATLCVMWMPYNFESTAKGSWLALQPVSWAAVAGNVVLLIPLGVIESRFVHLVMPRHGVVILIVAIDAAFLGIIGETVQMWLASRDSSLVDLVAYTIGGTFGALVAERAGSQSHRGTDG